MEYHSLLSRKDRLELEDGRTLRLLSALEVLEARREAEELIRDDRERALCANACLLARALERQGRPVFPTGRAVLEAMGPREVAALARRWDELDRAENPSPEEGEQAAQPLKKAWSTRLMSAFAGVCSGRLGPSQQRSGPDR
ncbi:hypothetical protein [Pseudoflavonifractor phocaeensis]|uniref:hypothetical protein n=1 Tax=Pseudoflavonifractor phocaeensis TaxID=1870988 RepID=UPI001FAF7754|nr:hypothetical protein [Pseudoflavonifractor phocaeensis]